MDKPPSAVTLRFKRDVLGIYNLLFPAGSTYEYTPWDHEWQGKTEPQRRKDGLFVVCYGQGEFNVFGPDDVEPA